MNNGPEGKSLHHDISHDMLEVRGFADRGSQFSALASVRIGKSQFPLNLRHYFFRD